MGPVRRPEVRLRTVSREKGLARRVSNTVRPVDESWDEGSFQVSDPGDSRYRILLMLIQAH